MNNKINWGSIFLSGVVWALVYSTLAAPLLFIFLGESYIEELKTMGHSINLSMDVVVKLAIFGLIFIVSWGVLTIWLYVVIRPNYGDGTKTALIASLVVWLLSVVAPLSHLAVFGVASLYFSITHIIIGLILIMTATLIASKQYKN